MKKDRIKSMVSVLLYAVSIIMIQLPWLLINGQRCTVYQGYTYAKELTAGGVKDIWIPDINILKMNLTLLVLYQIVSVCYIITVLLKKNWRLNIVAMLLVLADLLISQELSDDVMIVVFDFLLAGLCCFEFVITKMIDIWESAVQEANENAMKAQARKEEEKRRLYFPGNYTELFYQMVWKNFKYDWRDYSLLLMCSTVVSALSLAGIGCYQMMLGMHREENFLIGQGLGLILWNAMIPMGVCAVFLMVFVLIFYLRKWVESYSIFVTLGIREKTLFIIIALEIAGCFLVSVLLGILFGNGLMFLFRKVIYKVLGEGTLLLAVTVRTYVKMLGVMIAIYVISLMASRDIMMDFNLITASTRRIRRETMPGKGLRAMLLIGAVLMAGSIVMYSQLLRHECIWLLAVFFIGVFLVIRCGGAAYLRKEYKKETYLTKLMDRNHLYHKSQTAAWYLTALTVLYVCAVFYFTFQIVSVRVAEKPETLFPYDFVCIADDGDDEFFSGLEEKYGVEVTCYPMVRVSNVDKTEKSEGMARRPQGQQIGISETTFHQLKRAIDEDYEEKALELDEKGERVYIVHQQDRSVKAQPVDWTYGSGKPFLHIGLPCEFYTLNSLSKAFVQRKVAGEEIGSLIGCFRQGNLENMIVFSDEYFKEAQDMWRYTNIYTGDPIENEEERIEGITIFRGPAKLVLLEADQKDIDALEQEMETLKANHTYEAKYDAEVSCYYSKKAAVSDMETEHIMKVIVNLFVLAILLMASMFLVYVKTISELEEKTARAAFLKCMGMRKGERIRMLKGELYLFYLIPLFLSAAAAVCYTAATFHARMYGEEVIRRYLSGAAGIWIGWTAIEGVFIWILGLWLVRKVEGRDER